MIRYNNSQTNNQLINPKTNSSQILIYFKSNQTVQIEQSFERTTPFDKDSYCEFFYIIPELRRWFEPRNISFFSSFCLSPLGECSRLLALVLCGYSLRSSVMSLEMSETLVYSLTCHWHEAIVAPFLYRFTYFSVLLSIWFCWYLRICPVSDSPGWASKCELIGLLFPDEFLVEIGWPLYLNVRWLLHLTVRTTIKAASVPCLSLRSIYCVAEISHVLRCCLWVAGLIEIGDINFLSRVGHVGIHYLEILIVVPKGVTACFIPLTREHTSGSRYLFTICREICLKFVAWVWSYWQQVHSKGNFILFLIYFFRFNLFQFYSY